MWGGCGRHGDHFHPTFAASGSAEVLAQLRQAVGIGQAQVVAGEAELVLELLEGAGRAAVETEAGRDDLALDRLEVVEQVGCRRVQADQIVVELGRIAGPPVTVGVWPTLVAWPRVVAVVSVDP